jgi:hypothetical protein
LNTLAASANFDPIIVAPTGARICQGDRHSTRKDAHRFDLVVFCAEELPPGPVVARSTRRTTTPI